jgi:hypothetical protein
MTIKTDWTYSLGGVNATKVSLFILHPEIQAKIFLRGWNGRSLLYSRGHGREVIYFRRAGRVGGWTKLTVTRN